MFGQIIGSAAGDAIYYVPGGSTTALAAGRVAVITGARALTAISSGTKAKDQITLRYQLDGPDGKALLPPMTEKLKAREDGEDSVTPLVTKASKPWWPPSSSRAGTVAGLSVPERCRSV